MFNGKMTGRIKKLYKHKISIGEGRSKGDQQPKSMDIENLIQVVKSTKQVVTDLRYKEKVEDN